MKNQLTKRQQTCWALVIAVLLQALFYIPVANGLDPIDQWGISVLAYWGGASIILWRRWQSPTKTDIVVLCFGYLLLELLITPVVAHSVWKGLSRISP
jgi:hypothetical protein